MSKFKEVSNLYAILLALIIMSLMVGELSAATTRRASTKLFVVNVAKQQYGNMPTSEDVTLWPSWPQTDGDGHLQLTGPDHVMSDRVLMYDTNVAGHQITWSSYPYAYPWRGLPYLNSMICNVWSTDGGKTYTLVSWDYLTPTSHYIHLGSAFPQGWIGTMVHSFCGFEGNSSDVCNTRVRTNLVFDYYP